MDDFKTSSAIRYICVLLLAALLSALLVLNSKMQSDFEVMMVITCAFNLAALVAHGIESWLVARDVDKKKAAYKEVKINSCPGYWTTKGGCGKSGLKCEPFFKDRDRLKIFLSASNKILDLNTVDGTDQKEVCERSRDYSWTDLRVRCDAAKRAGGL